MKTVHHRCEMNVAAGAAWTVLRDFGAQRAVPMANRGEDHE